MAKIPGPATSGGSSDDPPDNEPVNQVGDAAEPETPAAKPARDLPLVAADALFHAALQAGQPGPKIENGDVIIVEAPSADWLRPVMEAAPFALFGRLEPLPKFRGLSARTDECPYRVFECLGSKEKSQDSLVNEIAIEIAEGCTIIIVTADIDLAVPKPIRDSADHILALRHPTADWLERVLVEATGDNQVEAGRDINWADVKPDMLKLAVRRGQSANDFVHRLAKLVVAARRPNQGAKLRLDDLHGMPEVIKWAKSLAADICDYKAGRLAWSDMDRGALMWGPPGVGKTLAARTIADYCGVTFFATSYSAWQGTGSGHLGDVTRAARAVFLEARKAAPAIIFLDELDTIGSRESDSKHGDWWRSIINMLLEELDGAAAREGVIVVGATNYPGNIDPALKRSGRLDREIQIGLPDTAALERIFAVYVDDALPKADLVRLAGLAIGHTGADVAAWVRRARRTARERRRDITFDDVMHEIVGDAAEHDRADLHRIAAHEAGHALIATLQNPAVPPSLMIGNGGQTALSATSRRVITPKEVDNMLMLALAGRAAEEIICGAPSAGAGGPAHSDLAKATRLAAMAEASYCLGSTGLIWSDVDNAEQLHTQLALRPGTEAAVRHRLDQAYEAAKATIVAHQPVVEKLAAALVDRMILTPEEVGEIIKGGLAPS
ncbi:AAA family ATPase [Acidocella sp.]|uniref:AAA family ATPase n=1 Tax=Acidocella sp. TaxID=50710 RepID=UPI002632A8F1|nr:AAA family ATPase [Acidocella sp.]